jgi:hypothetical protein
MVVMLFLMLVTLKPPLIITIVLNFVIAVIQADFVILDILDIIMPQLGGVYHQEL